MRAAGQVSAAAADGDRSSLSPALTVALGALVALVVLLPLPFGGWRPWAVSALQLTVGATALTVAASVALGRTRLRVPLRSYAVPLCLAAAVLLWCLVQTLTFVPAGWIHPIWPRASAALGETLPGSISINRQQTLLSAAQLLTYVIVFWLALQVAANAVAAHRLVQAVIFSSVLYSVYGIVVYFVGSATVLWYTKDVFTNALTGTFDNRNNFAAFAGIGLLASLALLFGKLARLARDDQEGGRPFLVGAAHLWTRAWWLFCATGVLGVAILLTGSRGALITLVVGAVVLVSALSRSKLFRSVNLSWLWISVVCAGVVLVLISGGLTLSRFDVDLLGEEPRLPAYASTLKGLQSNPWLGIGYGNFEAGFRLFREIDVLGRFTRAHSDVLENLFELGIPAALLLDVTLLILALVALGGGLRRRRQPELPCLAVAVTAQLGLHAFVDFSTQVPAVVIAFLVLLAVGVAQALESSRAEEQNAPRRTGDSIQLSPEAQTLELVGEGGRP